jgi:hypothetical protein
LNPSTLLALGRTHTTNTPTPVSAWRLTLLLSLVARSRSQLTCQHELQGIQQILPIASGDHVRHSVGRFEIGGGTQPGLLLQHLVGDIAYLEREAWRILLRRRVPNLFWYRQRSDRAVTLSDPEDTLSAMSRLRRDWTTTKTRAQAGAFEVAHEGGKTDAALGLAPQEKGGHQNRAPTTPWAE